jgi:hypothetical protein
MTLGGEIQKSRTTGKAPVGSREPGSAGCDDILFSVVKHRCDKTRTQPSGVELRCEFVQGVGFELPPVGERVAAFGWVLCDHHAEALQEMVQEEIRVDTAELAARMGLSPN